MKSKEIAQVAERLHQARLLGRPIEQFGKNVEGLNEEMAYQIQHLGIEKRQEQGEKILGYKMGLTSIAKRKQMNLHSSLYGVLTNRMQVESGESFNFAAANLIHPKIEPEIAFLTKRELRAGEGPIEELREEVIQAISHACTALEILDSRYQQFQYFSMEEVISDNSSSSHFILGRWMEFDREKNPLLFGLENLPMKMWVRTGHQKKGEAEALGKEQVIEGNSGDISGDPILSVVELVQLLGKSGLALPANSIVLAGAATVAIPLVSGQEIALEVEGMPSVSVSIR